MNTDQYPRCMVRRVEPSARGRSVVSRTVLRVRSLSPGQPRPSSGGSPCARPSSSSWTWRSPRTCGPRLTPHERLLGSNFSSARVHAGLQTDTLSKCQPLKYCRNFLDHLQNCSQILHFRQEPSRVSERFTSRRAAQPSADLAAILLWRSRRLYALSTEAVMAFAAFFAHLREGVLAVCSVLPLGFTAGWQVSRQRVGNAF